MDGYMNGWTDWDRYKAADKSECGGQAGSR